VVIGCNWKLNFVQVGLSAILVLIRSEF